MRLFMSSRACSCEGRRDFGSEADAAPRFSKVPIAIRALAALLAVWLWIGSGKSAAAPAEFPLLAMAVRTDRSVYWIGEPVAVRTRIVNWLSPALGVVSSLDLRGDADVRIIAGETIGDRYFAHYRPTVVTPGSFFVRYGEAIEFDLVLLYSADNASNLAFPDPGKYRIALSQSMLCTDRFRPWGRSGMALGAEAQSPIFTVVEPPAEARPALEILMSDRQFLKDLNEGQATFRSRSAFERVAREHADSRYAPYCLHALAMLSLSLAPSIEEEEKKAEGLFGRLIENYGDYPFRDKARAQMADFLYATARFNRAFDLIQSLIAESEDNMARFSESKMVSPLIGQVGNPYANQNLFHWYLFGTSRLPHAYYSRQISGSPQ